MTESGNIQITRGLTTAVVNKKAIPASFQEKFNSLLTEKLDGIPFIGIDNPNEAVAIQSKRLTGFSVAFDSASITKEDSVKIIEVLKESISELDLQPLIKWDKGQGVYVFNVFIK